MKKRIRKELVFVLTFLCAFTAFAQVEESEDAVVSNNAVVKSRIRVPENAIEINLGYSIPMLNNALLKNDFWDKKVGTDLYFNVNYRKQFMKKTIEDDEVISRPTWFSVGAGVGISYFKQSAGFDNYSETSSNSKDLDGDNCKMSFNFRNVEEKISLTYLDIPIYVEIGRPDRMKASAFFKVGVKASVKVSEKVAGEGNYTSDGYYSQWNVRLYDIPPLGYYPNNGCYSNTENEYSLSPFVLWGSVSGGVNLPLSNVKKNRIAKWMLRVSAQVDYSITPISKSLPNADDTGTKFRLFQSNMLGGENGSKMFSAGLTFGIIYCL